MKKGNGTKLATKMVGIGDSNVASLFTEPFLNSVPRVLRGDAKNRNKNNLCDSHEENISTKVGSYLTIVTIADGMMDVARHPAFAPKGRSKQQHFRESKQASKRFPRPSIILGTRT